MKLRIFLISILLVGTISAMACGEPGPVDPKYHWIFYTGYSTDCIWDGNSWQENLNERFREENITFWHNYVHQSVSREAVENALYNEYLLNNLTTNDFFKYLIDNKKQHKEALQYWLSLKASHASEAKEIRWKQSAWWYPESDQQFGWWEGNDPNEQDPAKQLMNLSILKVRTLDEKCIQQCQNKDICNRYVLQVMRKYFYTADYEKCCAVWRRYGATIPQSALRTQCLNYYGGALLRKGKKAEAATVYAKIGYFDVRLHYDPAVLRQVYLQQPNNKGFEFMVQQFVNYYFEQPRPYKAEAFNALVDEIIKEEKSHNLALWKSAQAALAYINGDNKTALSLLAASEKMPGTLVVKENIRLMRLMFNSTRTDMDSLYEETLYPDLRWLTNNIRNDLHKDVDLQYDKYWWFGNYSNPALHRWKVFRRVIFLGAIPHFERTGQIYKSIAYLTFFNDIFDAYDSRKQTLNEQWKYYENKVAALTDYGLQLFDYMDTTNVANVIKYVDFLRSGGQTPAEKFLVRNSSRNMDYLNEQIGTKYMRKEQWATASHYLQKVSPKYVKTQAIAGYINKNLNPFAELWITQKELQGQYGLSFNPVKEYASNPSKSTFCQLMLKLRQESQSAKTAEERATAAYAYAVGLYQSSLGYAWALENYFCDWYNSVEYLEDLPTYFSRGYQEKALRLQQKKVDKWIEKAMIYDKDKIFTLKCKILHSQYRKKMKEPKKEIHIGCLCIVPEFNEEVRNTFCDQSLDYDEFSSRRWRESAWCY